MSQEKPGNPIPFMVIQKTKNRSDPVTDQNITPTKKEQTKLKNIKHEAAHRSASLYDYPILVFKRALNPFPNPRKRRKEKTKERTPPYSAWVPASLIHFNLFSIGAIADA